MYKYTLVLALLSVASAQSTTSLLLIGFDKQDIVASIVGSDSTATTFSIACGNPDSDDCGIPESFTFTQGPSTVHYNYHVTDDGSDESIDLGCIMTSSDHGICTGGMVGNFDGTSTSTSYTTSFSTAGSDASEYAQYQAVTITAGAAGSSASTAASTTQGSSDASSATNSASGSAASQASGMTTATSTRASGTKTSGASSSAASSGSGSSAVSTAGMALITGKPRWALGGAAAALALAAM